MTARAAFFSARNPAPPPEFDPDGGAKLPAPPIPGRGLNGIRLFGRIIQRNVTSAMDRRAGRRTEAFVFGGVWRVHVMV